MRGRIIAASRNWHAEIFADLPRQMIVDLVVAWDCAPAIEAWIAPPGVPAALP
jgi:hypothetical protein